MELFLHYLSLAYLLQGILLTLQVTALGLAGGLFLGMALAAMQMSRQRWLSGFARTYAVIFRGTPLILQMVFVYDALPHIGIKFSALVAGGIALAANEGPFFAEILRSGIRSVDRGQVAAGQALGMPSAMLMRRIVAPQAIRTMIPAFGSEAVSALKNSSLASIISVQELTLRSTQLASSTFDFFSVFFASGVLYLILTSAVAGIQLLTERWLDLDRASSRRGLSRRFFGKGATAPDHDEQQASDAHAAGSAVVKRDSRPAAPVAPVKPSPAQAMVEVSSLGKQYDNHPVFHSLSLTVRQGEVVALLGPSGSGKSTLLRCINRLEDWDTGEVRISGQRVGFHADGSAMSMSEIARQRAYAGVGMVFQHFNLFGHLTALENVAGPLRWVHGMSAADAQHRAMELLDRVGLRHRAHALPRHLSGGQQQRVAIARALAPRPSVLLLDEPTSALDPEMVNEVLEVIRKLATEDGLTMIISTHQVRFAKEVADRVVFLSNGAVTEEGPAHEVLTRPRHPLTARFLSVMQGDYPETITA
ncbi:amino acid ABC transporter permease/ATP-binding protein [Noviherbaspirillum pedocola]|uniref:Amino acid ABC transporter permease/ATP-binding protein n=1 Tax=Noviherbaspirillum pedocola TaxID=2801341 RepID=A0A934SZ66_9BURK|nr:amino acid ABC transporter permease/ATP-binding protein [Noviherbaspirillum pedocola]MBK4735374.1 amino acid ABC transporter permease/ATP-binding protein [Noviherbaspirillum pedocola]